MSTNPCDGPHWPPATIQEWVAWRRWCMERDESPEDFKEGYDEAICDLLLFLNLDFTRPDSSTDGYATRAEPPLVGDWR